MKVPYLSDDSLSGAVVFVEQVVGLDEELTGVLLFPSRPPPPQDDRTMGALLLMNSAHPLNRNVFSKTETPEPQCVDECR